MTRVVAQAPSSSRLARIDGPPSRRSCVGPWELVHLAGQGAWSRVYRARPAGASGDTPAGYALKMLRPDRPADDAAIELLRREAAVGRQVVHPHVVAILSGSVAQPPYYLVMPWLEGVTLRQRLDRTRPLPLRTALWIARQVATGLDGLAQAGWIHGDVKPGNVLLAADGHATLLDLGFARPVGEVGNLADRCVLGTPSYMAPEALTATVAAAPQSDLYSLGVVLYEMLAGRLPFEARDLGQLVQEHRQSSPPPLTKLAPWAPADVIDLTRRLLAKDPLRRPESAREVVQQLTAMEIAALAQLAGG